MQSSDTALLRLCFAASAFCILHSALIGCASAPARRSEQALAQLRTDILAVTQRPGVTRGSWGIAVHSLDRRERLIDLNSGRLFVPASIAKLVSVATAADAVGWDHRFETPLIVAGSVSEGTLAGDLIVVGSGDPSIGGREGGDLSEFVAAVKAAGITRIEGRVIGDDDSLEEPRPQLSWAWDDLGYVTGALFGALNFAENRMVVTIAPGVADGSPTASLDPHATGRPIVNRSVTGPPGSPQLLWPEQRPGEPFLTIAGSVPAGGRPAQVAVATGNPTLWFASALRRHLLDEGIVVTGEALDVDDVTPSPNRAGSTVLFTHRSATLAQLAVPLLKDSINLYAEAFFRLNAGRGALPTNDAAIAGMSQRLTAWGVPKDSYQLVDGSGLSRRDAISPEAVLTVLARMVDESGTSPFVAALPIAGIDGSLAERMKGTAAQGNVRAKTGTMSNIRSLAGYVTTRGGERLGFVIIVNNFEGTGVEANEAIDAIAVRLAEFTGRRRTGLQR